MAFVNRGCHRWIITALCGAVPAAPAIAEDPAPPSLTIEPIVARDLLSPMMDPRARAYRLGPGNDRAAGRRARISIDLGKSTLFAITGRLTRQPVPTGALDPGHARALGQRRDSGKVYGAGVARSVRGVDLSATYQYSKIGSAQPGPVSEAGNDGPGKSHSLQATARIRFRP